MATELDLNYVRSLVAIVREGSFAAAARATRLPTSSLSRQISRLEAQLGTRLLERTTRSLRLTEAGRLLVERARPMVDDMSQLAASLQHYQTSFRGSLDVGVPTELARRWLGTILARFAVEHPHVECRMHLDASDPLAAGLDLALTFQRGPVSASSMIAQKLKSWPSHVIAAPSLLARTGMPSRLAQLASLPCISTLAALDGAPWRFLTRDGCIVHSPVAARYRVDSAALACTAAEQGVGFALLPEPCCREALRVGTVELVPLELAPAPLDLLVVYPSREHQAPKMRALLAALRDSADGLKRRANPPAGQK